jgi:3'-phosphoadenosine 5'-phosphosulfate sulfotransferase (PAPS reductase)/FAD synthetase
MSAATRRVRWFGCGTASAVAIALDLKAYPGGVVAYCETNAEHPDNARFLSDCARWWGVPVLRLRSDEYTDTWDVWERRQYLAGNDGAPCTGILKVAPRHAFQHPDDIHVFGYTCDANDLARAKRLRHVFHELTVETPLISAGLDKAACHAIVQGAGIALPVMYGLGFSNSNCIPCPKATSPDYWSAMRLHFPAQFARMAELSRRLGARLTRIADVRLFIDEIPADWPVTKALAPACDFLCHIAAQDLAP